MIQTLFFGSSYNATNSPLKLDMNYLSLIVDCPFKHETNHFLNNLDFEVIDLSCRISTIFSLHAGF